MLIEETRSVLCPYCFQEIALCLDRTAGARQQYIEDCPVCCQPMEVTITWSSDGDADIEVERAQ